MNYKRKEVIGDCTLYLGDCIDIMPNIGDVDAVVTDPPYGMCFVSSRRKLETKHMPIKNDNNTTMLRFICKLKANRTGNTLHPTEKPVGLMEVIVDWTAGVVIDPFMGSGSTGVACANLGRKFIGIELEEKYFDIACKRIEQAYIQPNLFIEPPKEFKQETLL